MTRLLQVLLSLLLTAVPLAAQDARITSRFDPSTAEAITGLIEAAAARGVPAEPLVQKALEGATKGAKPAAIERAVRTLAERLSVARQTLGVDASEAEMMAAASALYVGVTPEALGRLRSLRPAHSLAMPLVALTFFVQRGVAADASLKWVESLIAANVGGEELLRLQQSIDADIRSGATPGAASATRIEALLRRHPGTRR